MPPKASLCPLWTRKAANSVHLHHPCLLPRRQRKRAVMVRPFLFNLVDRLEGFGFGKTNSDSLTMVLGTLFSKHFVGRLTGRHQVLRIETKQVPRASKAEVVLSDG